MLCNVSFPIVAYALETEIHYALYSKKPICVLGKDSSLFSTAALSLAQEKSCEELARVWYRTQARLLDLGVWIIVGLWRSSTSGCWGSLGFGEESLQR